MKSKYTDIGEYYNDQTKNMSDYERQRWFTRKASIHSYNQTKSIVNHYLKNRHFERTIEIGCGAGTWTQEIVNYSEYILGVDISKNMIDFARQKQLCVDWQIMNFLEINNAIYNDFDLLVSVRMLRFIRDLDQFFGKVHSTLNDNGTCFIIDLNPWWLRRRIFGADEDHYTDVYLRSPISMKEKMIEYGFEDIQIRPAVVYLPPPFEPLLKIWMSIHQHNLNTNLHKMLWPVTESYAIWGHL